MPFHDRSIMVADYDYDDDDRYDDQRNDRYGLFKTLTLLWLVRLLLRNI